MVLVRLPSLKIPDPQHSCIPKRHRVKFGALGALCYDTLPREPIPNGELPMSQTEKSVAWVVYLMTLRNHQGGMNAVCEQSEWDEMERARPGYHTLIRAGITNEGEAERLARGTSGDPKGRRP